MANPEKKGMAEKAIWYSNVIDVGAIAVGAATGNPVVIFAGVAGLAAGKVAGDKLRERRERG